MSTEKESRNTEFFNPEVSRLMFIKRVFEQACDHNLPLLERLNYIFITSAILDEFFEITVAGIKERIALSRTETSVDGLSSTELLKVIADITHPFVKSIYDVYNNDLTPELIKESIHFFQQKNGQKGSVSGFKNFSTNMRCQ